MNILEAKTAGTPSGMRILITGASSGIGRALAKRFLEEGAKVAVCARREPLLSPLKSKNTLAFCADVTKLSDIKLMIAEIEKSLGGLDALINNAAVLKKGRLTEQPVQEWTETLETDLNAPFLLSRLASPLISKGAIINISSGLSVYPMEPYGAYCVAKAGLNMLTRTLAMEWNGKIAVNAINPGVIHTEMNTSASEEPETLYPIVRALVLNGPKGPTGRFFDKTGLEISWG